MDEEAHGRERDSQALFAFRAVFQAAGLSPRDAAVLHPHPTEKGPLCTFEKRATRRTAWPVLALSVSFAVAAGCRATGARWSHGKPVRQVVCLFDQKPWLNLDAAGDLDPEGIHFRVYLDPGSGLGVLRKGSFYVQLYVVERKPDGEVSRTLASDWRIPTKRVQPIRSPILGYGYHLKLRWARKSIAGREIEIVTTFEDPSGHVVRSGTKRLRVPKYNT